MKRVIAFLLAVFMVIPLSSCKKKDETNTSASQITPLLYKVTEFDGDVVWILGSIHYGKDYMYPLPDYIYDALDNSDYLAVECDMVSAEQNPEIFNLLYSLLWYEDGTTIKDHISPELYESAVKIMTDIGAYNPSLDYYKPSLWSNIIYSHNYEHFGHDYTLGVDRHLMARAEKNDMELREIESMIFQYAMFSNYSEGLQEFVLQDSVDNHETDELNESIDSLINSWCIGDEEALTKYIEEPGDFEAEETKRLLEEYNGTMYTKRNYTMANYAEKALKYSEEAFICVGILHVVGEKGIVSILRDRGYTVEIIR